MLQGLDIPLFCFNISIENTNQGPFSLDQNFQRLVKINRIFGVTLITQLRRS